VIDAHSSQHVYAHHISSKRDSEFGFVNDHDNSLPCATKDDKGHVEENGKCSSLVIVDFQRDVRFRSCQFFKR